MRDSFSRKIDYLRISVTDRCNLRCRYCMPEEGVGSIGHGSVLSYEELFRVARIAVKLGVRKIRLTGGEPLVRKGLLSFIESLVQLPENPELTLTTNGLLLEENAASLKAVGLSRINVSLDTLREDRFQKITRRSGLQKVLAGLDAAEKVGLKPLKVNMVPILGVNEDEIVDFARLTMRRQCQVRFIEFMPVSSNLEYTADQLYPAAKIRADLQSIAPLQEENISGIFGPAKIYRLQGAVGTVGIIPAVSEHFCRECNRLRLTADGFLKPCLLSQQEIDLRSILRSGVDDQALAELLEESVTNKPEKHCLGPDYVPGNRQMQNIGG